MLILATCDMMWTWFPYDLITAILFLVFAAVAADTSRAYCDKWLAKDQRRKKRIRANMANVENSRISAYNAKLDSLKKLLQCEEIGGGTFVVRDPESQKIVDELRSALDRATDVEEARSSLTKKIRERRQQAPPVSGDEVHDAESVAADTPSSSESAGDQEVSTPEHDDERSGYGLIFELIRGKAADGAEVDEERRSSLLKLILAAGANPDLSDRRGHRVRPSHGCARDARLEEAKLIFLCRPHLDARNSDGDTPLSAAKRDNHQGEDNTPELKLLRPRVAEEMKKFYDEGFPSLARMACQRDWFAVKNLVRRHAVAESELRGTFGGKTAREWALRYGLTAVAEELEYYEGLLSCKVMELFNQLAAMKHSFAEYDDQIEALNRKIQSLEASLTQHITSADASGGEIPHRLRPYHHERRDSHEITSSTSMGEASIATAPFYPETREGFESLDANRPLVTKEELLSPAGIDTGADSKISFALAVAMEENDRKKDERRKGGHIGHGVVVLEEVRSSTADSEDRSTSVELLIEDGVNVMEF